MGMEDIPGVFEPIEEPYERFKRKIYADPVVDVPVLKIKSIFHPTVLVEKISYYFAEMWVDMAHNVIQSIKVTKPRRYYHQKYRRVPEIWECYSDDDVCIFEAELQFQRDKKVDEEILNLLKARAHACREMVGVNGLYRCQHLHEVYEKCKHAFNIKYADQGHLCNARNVLIKQKNRFIEERYLARQGIHINQNE